jgi:hypothetical protein
MRRPFAGRLAEATGSAVWSARTEPGLEPSRYALRTRILTENSADVFDDLDRFGRRFSRPLDRRSSRREPARRARRARLDARFYSAGPSATSARGYALRTRPKRTLRVRLVYRGSQCVARRCESTGAPCECVEHDLAILRAEMDSALVAVECEAVRLRELRVSRPDRGDLRGERRRWSSAELL